MKSLIIVAENFQDEEFVYPYYYLSEFCEYVDVASVDGKFRYGKYGVPARVNKSFADCLDQEAYDSIIIPGGFECPDRLRIIPEALELVRRHFELGKVVGAICHGPWVLISSGIVSGKRVTGYIAIKDDLVNAGASYITDDVVVDHKLVTSPHYANNPQFMKSIKDLLTAL